MALSGSKTGSVTLNSNYFSFYFEWSATQSETGNYSDVTVNTYISTNDIWQTFDTVGARDHSITINGDTTKISKVINCNPWNSSKTYHIQSKTTRVYHNDNGEKSITISARSNGLASSWGYSSTNASSGDATASATITLDTIPRHPNVPAVSSPTTSTISETSTSISVKWATTNRGTYTIEVSKDGGAYSVVKSGIAIGTLTYSYTITPSQGDTYRFRVKAVYNSLSSDYSYSGTVTINKLNPPTIGTISTYNPYVTSALSVPLSGGSQTNGGAFKRMADLYYGSTLLASCTTPSNGNTSASITYAAANYASKLGTKAYSGKFKIVAWIQNGNGSRSSYVNKEFTVNLNSDGNAVPTLSAPTLSGGLSGYSASCFVAGKHNLTVTSGSASANRAPSGVTLSYKISCTGFSDVASSTATFTSPTAGKKTIVVTVTDSRGLSASKTVYCRFQSWAKPTVTITSADRDENTPSTINVVYTIKYTTIYNTYGSDGDTAGTNINSISSQQYTTNTTYVNCTSPLSITGTSIESGYTVTIRASDKIDSTAYGTASRFVGTVEKYISFRAGMIGFGCVPTGGFRFVAKGGVRFYTDTGDVRINNGNIYTSGNIVIPNNKYLYTYRADGTTHSLLAMGSSDNVALNYHGYRDSVGITTVYGNDLALASRNTITTNVGMTINGVLQAVNAGSTVGSRRFNQTWTGYYDTNADAVSNTNRRAWIGHSSTDSTTFYVANEHGNAIVLRSYNDDSVVSGLTISNTAVYPDTDNTRNSGSSGYRWINVYATNGTINTSDRTHKKNIKELDDKYIQLFNKLIPVSFEFNYADSDRVHIGFISQDVESAMDELGISDLEFAGFCKDKQQIYNEETDTWTDILDEDGNPTYIYSLRYQEFIALNTFMIQKQQKEIEELKRIIQGGI